MDTKSEAERYLKEILVSPDHDALIGILRAYLEDRKNALEEAAVRTPMSKPTIYELEKILEESPGKVALAPDGSVHVGPSYEELEAELARLREALKVANQLVIEVNHAYTQGPEWYTRGESGLRQQVAMWIDKASKAIQEALKSNDS